MTIDGRRVTLDKDSYTREEVAALLLRAATADPAPPVAPPGRPIIPRADLFKGDNLARIASGAATLADD